MNRTFTLCFLLYPIALPFGYVLVYTFYHYAVPDANSNLALRTPYLLTTNNGKLLETIKNIHNAFDLSVPTIIKTTGSGVRCCIGYNYGKASSYGAYLWFDVFFTCSFVICSNGVWHNYTLNKTEST